jgi:hypothetical protein
MMKEADLVVEALGSRWHDLWFVDHRSR